MSGGNDNDVPVRLQTCRPRLRLVGHEEQRLDNNADAVQAMMERMDEVTKGLPAFDGGMTVALAAVLWLDGPCGGLTRAVALLADVAANLDDEPDGPDGGSELEAA